MTQVPRPPDRPAGWEKWAPRPKVVAGALTVLIVVGLLALIRLAGLADLLDLDRLLAMLAGGGIAVGGAYGKTE